MKKMIALLLVITLIFSGFTGCKKKNKNEDAVTSQDQSLKDADSNQVQTTGDGQIIAGDQVVAAPKQAPIGIWDIPVPEINPLGAQNQYTQTDYQSGYHGLNYIKDFAEYKQDINGEVWTLFVGDTSATALEALKTYAISLGAEVMDSQYGDRLIFSLTMDGESLWWGDAILQEEGYELTVVRQLEIPVGKEIILKTADISTEENRISFVTRSKGKKFQTLTLTLPNGDVVLEATEDSYTRMTERRVSYRQELSAIKTNSFLLDSIPQGEGSLNWVVTWYEESKPSEITVLLEETIDIPYVKRTEELGALKVCNVPFGQVVVKPANSVSYNYADGFSTEADITPEGDSLFWLPPGLWNVYLTTTEAGFYESLTRLIPVSSGELTTLTLPTSLKSTYYTLNNLYASPENVTGSMKITKATESGGKGVISLMVEDPQKRDVFPNIDNTTIVESGQKVVITDITRQIMPPSIVLVLDSSGSMEKSMKATIAAAKEFISGLPDKSFIKVVDFDAEIRVLKGETKEEVMKNLSKIKANGYTALFDATITGLQLLEGKERPALVVFSDGADSSTDGTGKGSSSSKDDVIHTAEEAGIPIYTIGFGDAPDKAALKELANASSGQYYSAKNDKALVNVFTAINSKFGNYFVMTYNRPKEADNADTPVVAMVIDASGSMNTDPAEEGCGYRIDKVKGLFHNFVLKLPDQCLMQLISFQTYSMGSQMINLEQITSSDKASILQGIGEIEAGGGTPIVDSIQMAYENLKAVPSNNKVIVYLTDAALEVEVEEQELFHRLLKEIKEENITILFVGMGVDDKEAVFIEASQISGGRYIISEDPMVLNATLEEILSEIKTNKEVTKLPLSININDETSSGEILNYDINTTVNFTPPPKSGKIIEPEPVKYVTGTPMKRYDSAVAALLTGTSIPSKETILTKRIAFDMNATNKAMKLSVKEAFLFRMFKGLEPTEMQFMALQLDLKNIHAEKIQYQIPNMSSHFYVNINNEGMYPASDATWLTEKPLTNPGKYEINIFPDKDLSGMLMFLVPNVPITQMSLHFYDTAYGHIEIPLVGVMKQELLKLKKLPTTPPVNIAESFTMAVTSSSDVAKLDIYQSPENTSFRVVEAELTSNVQALLNINPAERLWMKTYTAMGPLMVQMSDVTAYTPFGFMKPRMLGAGSSNKIRMVYPIANSLIGTKTEIYGDINEGSLSVPIVPSGSFGSKSTKTAVSQNGVKVRVNQLTTLEGVEGYGKDWAVADITVIDEKDGWGTLITPDFFKLVLDGYELEKVVVDNGDSDYEEEYQEEEYVEEEDAEEVSEDQSDGEEEETDDISIDGVGLGDFSDNSSDSIREPEYFTSKLLYGISEEWGVNDNTERRGFILFTIPEEGSSWSLKSPYLENLNEPLKQEKYANGSLLVEKLVLEFKNEEFDKALEEAVGQAILQYEAVKSVTGDTGYINTVGLEKGDGKNNIPVPTIVYHGAAKINSVKTMEDSIKIMQGLQCVLTAYTDLQYSPEAVITQGWGNQWDLTNLAMGLVAKNGFVPSMRTINLTESGQSKLQEACKIEYTAIESIPGVSYLDQNGNSKIFVIPFMKDISELKGIVYLPSDPSDMEYLPSKAMIKVSVKVELDENTAQIMMGDMGAILGGEEEGGAYYDYIELLSKEIPLTQLSKDAIEIGYMKAGNGTGLRYMAAISTSDGFESGTGIIDTGIMKTLGLKIEIELPGGTKIHEVTLQEGEELDKIIQTIGINLPDLTEEATKSLQEAFTKEYKAAKDPDSFSVLKWYSRNILNRFIASQSIFDRDIAEDLELTLGRIYKERCIMVTSRMGKDNQMRTTIDLMQASNEIHNGEETSKAAYNIGSGLFLSSLEGSALTGEDKVDYVDLWEMAPESTALIVVADDYELRIETLEMMKSRGIFPAHLLETIENTEKIIIVTDKPILYKGEERWAWLEIDNLTYETISVFDTGEHAGMASYAMTKMPTYKEGLKYIVGAFIGVDVAVWSVCSMTLVLDDYEEILKQAEAMATDIGKQLKFVMIGKDGTVLGFKQGYDTAVAEYFARSRKAGNK